MPPKINPTKTNVFAITPEYREQVRQQSYIGKKGYTIPKSVLDKKDIILIKEECTMIPFTSSAYGGAGDDGKFYVFRESDNKIYIPRFYGIERYGLPVRSDISEGMDIDCHFAGSLREIQKPIVQTYLDHVQNGSGGAILEAECAAGKCLGINTPIIMFDGSIKKVQDIVVGEQIMGDDSTPRNVLSLARGREMMYSINQENFDGFDPFSYTVNQSHILSLVNSENNTIVDISVEKYLSLDNSSQYLGYRVPLENSSRDNRQIILNQTIELFGRIIETPFGKKQKRYSNQLLIDLLEEHGIRGGICGYDIKCKSKKMLQNIIFLAQSLGYTVKKLNYTRHRILITNRIPLIYKITVSQKTVDDYYGFTIDGNHRFVLGDFTVTHNTVMGINILATLKKKTLILVHKEFLMNQWIERMGTFIPNAKIGIIQADVFDVAGKDVVIGMIQTMYRKDWGNQLDDFGLTIIDEVHRIGSEEFSKTLLKVSTPYMLGISATVERKDKLTRILFMFIGPKIYTSIRKSTDTVVVRGLKYITKDTEFNEVEYDYRGNVKYSTMISKICNFIPRCQFILGVLKDLINENSEAQIIVLCHNICLLQFLYDGLEREKFATFGYYKGGMKKNQLKMTEDKQIVLGSYAMASEGLDIPTLSTLVLATPKTDIVQCVGRILRVKRDNPIIVDIVDIHPTFQNQWNKRKTYYRKCNYTILQGTSISNCESTQRRCHKKTSDVSSEEEEEEEEKKIECEVDLDDEN
jgi:superfamily II DNA or RNA helicase